MNGDVGVELCQTRDGDGCSRGSDVLLSQEELSSEVCDGDGVGVEESDGFDSGESDVLGCRGGKIEKRERRRERERWEEERVQLELNHGSSPGQEDEIEGLEKTHQSQHQDPELQ